MCFSLRVRETPSRCKLLLIAGLCSFVISAGYVGWKYSFHPSPFLSRLEPGKQTSVGLYLLQFKRDMETTKIFRSLVKFPDFCANDWPCLTNEAASYPVYTVSGAATKSADFITYTKHRKFACMGDIKCEHGVIMKFFEVVTDIFESMRPENLFAYQPTPDRGALTSFFQLQEDALAIDYFKSMHEKFLEHTDELRSSITPEEFTAIEKVYAELPSFPEKHGLLVSKLTLEEIDRVFTEARKNSVDGKDLHRLYEILLSYKKTNPRLPASIR